MLLGDALWARSQGLELGIDLAVALSRSRASAEGDRQVPSPADLRLSENSTVPRYFGILVFWYFCNCRDDSICLCLPRLCMLD